MAVPIDEGVLSALRGNISESTRLPKPLIIKVYVSSLKDEFKEERRMILELVGPEIQALYDDRQVEIEIIDMHFGTGPDNILMHELDPYLVHDYLMEIETCHQVSKSVFFLALVGEKIGKMCLPTHLPVDIFSALVDTCDNSSKSLLNKWYTRTIDASGQYILKENYRDLLIEDWQKDYEQMVNAIEKGCNELLKSPSSTANQNFSNLLKEIKMTPLEKEINRALELSPDRIIAVFREWSSQLVSLSCDSESRERLRKIKDKLTLSLPSDNYTTLIVPGKSTVYSIDTECDEHEIYLNKFKNKLMDKMRNLCEQSLANDPDVIKGRKKTVQEIFHEHSTHLRFLNDHIKSINLISSTIPDRIHSTILQNYRSRNRHPPFFIYGGHGSGKSTLMVNLYKQIKKWFEHNKVHRIIRFASATPRSGYNLELLRVICQQISIIYDIPEGYLPKDASFDPLYINNWFQNLLRRCEDSNHEILVLFIDDLHRLNPLDCDIVAALSWLPISLPWNVFLICSTTIPIDQLRFTPIQKDRFKSAEYLYDLSLEANKTIFNEKCWNNLEDKIISAFDALETKYGRKGYGRLASYITCSEYGLTETELLELLMPTESSDAMIQTKDGNFNFSTFRKIRNDMNKLRLLREKMMSGKILIEWRHRFSAELAKSRYMDVNSTRTMHTEIANIFFNQYSEESDETTTERTENTESQKGKEESSSMKQQQQQPQDTTSSLFCPPGADVSYSIRHVEESWLHLMRSDDTDKFKQIAVCNFDFLLAAVQTVSISYLRCLIEHVRCYILDRDIELIYYTIRKSSDVLTRDPMQLGAQLISWLRPFNEHDENDNSLLSITVRSATAWCDGYTVPLLVPLIGWLPPPLPSQIRTMTVSGTGPIRDVCVAPSKQHLLIPTKAGDVQLWHIMSNSLVHTFKGHSEAITCMNVGPQSNLLLTASEDATVIVWDINSRTMKTRIKEHVGAVLGVTCALNNTLAISGGEDSKIIIADISTGKALHKIEHHRGPVTAVKFCTTSEVLVSASRDSTICLWSLDDYSLLNYIQLNSPIIRIAISCDSVFLLAHCEDNGLYLRALATGTELHPLKGHKSRIRTMTIAMDSQRAVVGCEDTKALIFDIHSGRLIRTLPPNPGSVTAVNVMENDDFLITVGGNKITFYSFRNEEGYLNPYSHHRRKRTPKHMPPQQRFSITNSPLIVCFDVSRDSQLAAFSSGKSVHIIQINNPEYQTSFDGHTGTVTCLHFSPNNEFIVSGSEDKTVICWSLSLGLIAGTFKNHNATITCVNVLMDSRRVISADKEGYLYVWLVESSTLMQTIQGPHKFLAVTNNMKFAVCTNGDNTLKIWSLTREDEKYSVSHADEITCFAITADSLYVITGSRDMSLKVWQATGGKLAQVLVGHSDAVTCVAVSITNKTQVISGSKDCNLIAWDILTGDEIHTLAGHLAQVTCVKISADGTTAVSGSDDKTLIVWETKRGLALTSLQIHVPFTRFDISLECSRILIQLVDNYNLPVICLHNTPASYVKLPIYSAPARDVEDLRPAQPKRQMKRLLKKEVSLDTYTWQKKYGHLTSSVMMAQVDERLKRRFSVSASMEEISKIAEMKTLASQTSLCPEQAALAQSQHFDQLEALWNKRSPPRRRHNNPLSRQSSLVEDRIESSDEDEFQEERAGTFKLSSLYSSNKHNISSGNSGSGSGYNSFEIGYNRGRPCRPHSLQIGAWKNSYPLNYDNNNRSSNYNSNYCGSSSSSNTLSRFKKNDNNNNNSSFSCSSNSSISNLNASSDIFTGNQQSNEQVQQAHNHRLYGHRKQLHQQQHHQQPDIVRDHLFSLDSLNFNIRGGKKSSRENSPNLIKLKQRMKNDNNYNSMGKRINEQQIMSESFALKEINENSSENSIWQRNDENRNDGNSRIDNNNWILNSSIVSDDISGESAACVASSVAHYYCRNSNEYLTPIKLIKNQEHNAQGHQDKDDDNYLLLQQRHYKKSQNGKKKKSRKISPSCIAQ